VRTRAPDLAAWVPDPQVCTLHRRESRADQDVLWRAASELRVDDTRTLGRLVRWRIPGLARGITFDAMFRDYPFTVLDEGERHLMAGLCGRIWTPARDYPRLSDPEEFREWDEPGTVRVAFAHWVETTDRGSALMSETRVEPVDRRAALRLRALWAAVGVFERLIGGEALARAARQAVA
jgi:hypothetical protein